MNEDKAFLGRGWSFPPTFQRSGDGSGVAMVAGREDIDQSLEILLSTSLGERVLQSRYGCNLSDYQFEAMDTAFVGLLRDMVHTAILYHEPRIDVDKITVTDDSSPLALSGMVLIEVSYRIRATNSRFNFVYPFYRTEGVSPI
ncbi:MAG: GPW/gp25 family protein [Bacteroidota bacterium]